MVRGLGEDRVESRGISLRRGASALVSKSRTKKLITEFAEKVNNNPQGIADEDIKTLQGTGLSDKGTIPINSFK